MTTEVTDNKPEDVNENDAKNTFMKSIKKTIKQVSAGQTAKAQHTFSDVLKSSTTAKTNAMKGDIKTQMFFGIDGDSTDSDTKKELE